MELNRPAMPPEKKPLTEWEGSLTRPPVVLQRTHDRSVQRQLAEWTCLGGQNVEQAGEWIEINEAQSHGFGGAQAGCRDQSDDRRIRAGMKRRVLRRQGPSLPQNQTYLPGGINMWGPALDRGTDQPLTGHFRAWIDGSAITGKIAKGSQAGGEITTILRLRLRGPLQRERGLQRLSRRDAIGESGEGNNVLTLAG